MSVETTPIALSVATPITLSVATPITLLEQTLIVTTPTNIHSDHTHISSQ